MTPASAPLAPMPVTPNVGGQSAGITGASNKNGADSPGPVTSSTIPTPATTGSAPLSTQLRDLLDPATLTDIRRLETTGTAGGSPQALERAAAALRARADWLDATVPRDARQGTSEVTRTGRRGYTATECGGRDARERCF